ncbi:MAG TPA: hypothetical protein EYQ00_08320 [Dehalococcoidia bacterium]|jgi:hypothetical protein|nr:hypothetical protein [Dehalococcoidia bacterium]
MKHQDHNLEILGTLYKDESGELMLLSEHGLHHVTIESKDSLPTPANSTLYTHVHEVNWGTDQPEIWACDLWENLVEDTKDDYGEEEAVKLRTAITKTFPAVILSNTHT